MGLLTDTRTQALLSRVIIATHKPLEVILYIAGVASLLALAFTPFNARTYFSENALLPGLVERKYFNDQDVGVYAKELTRLASLENGKAGMPVDWLQEQFMALGLDVFAQNFTVNHPFVVKNDSVQAEDDLSGTNVYAILRAPRIASTEAMVITVPYHNRQVEKSGGRTHFGIGLLLSLANFFSKNTYWSKDIIFVVVDKGELGMQAWLSGYHDSYSDYIQSSLMLGRSGSIIAAINLELGSEWTDHIDLKIEGVNGQLPNLDLFNLAVRLCRVEKVRATFQNRLDPPDHLVVQWKGFKHAATTMLLNMAKQASGNPSGIHGLFLRYHIEALTLQAHPAKRSGASLVDIGRVMEGIIRSINNLLERFHQSFFFYVLPGCERYVSIGLYMIPFGLLLLVPTIRAMALWLQTIQPTELNSTTTEKTDDTVQDTSNKVQDDSNEVNQQGRPFAQIIPLIIGAHIIGAVLFISPEYLVSHHISSFSLGPKGALATGFLAYFFGTATLPIFGRRSNFKTSAEQPSDWQLLKSFTLIWFTASLLAVSMFNFSLAFFIAAPTIPVAVLIRPTQSKIFHILQGVLLLIISPLAMLYTFLTCYNGYFSLQNPLSEMLVDGLYKTVDSLYDGVLDAYLYGNKLFALVTLVWFPVWFLLWIVLFRK